MIKIKCHDCEFEASNFSDESINVWNFSTYYCTLCESRNIGLYQNSKCILNENSPVCQYPECVNKLPTLWLERGDPETGLAKIYEYNFGSSETVVNFHTTCRDHIGVKPPKQKEKTASWFTDNSWRYSWEGANEPSKYGTEQNSVIKDNHQSDTEDIDATAWFTRNKLNLRKCKHGHPTVVRTNRYTKEKFLGCSTYPKCNWTSKCKFGHDSVIRRNKYSGDYFLGCSEYPKCGWTESITDRINN
ncbi:MAG: hypothetical protein CMQ57_01125 [Gammaproteobacteria bacterium]|nr:hypothetical protein [Gammaproteobacteria bacterium]|tara:strand:+ start:1480 stop:2214 length:735 start_codon:yes stop_codon:yes gene_type:complete